MTPLGTSLSTPVQPSMPSMPSKEEALRALSVELETTFLTEMLKHSGLGKTQESFGGGIGEEQFSSMRLEQTAKQISRNGGIGLAENLFQALMKRTE